MTTLSTPSNQNPSTPTPRKGWESAFHSMHENGDDNLLIDDVFEDEDFEEWVMHQLTE